MNYTPKQKAFIKSKIKGIRFEAIPDSLKQFWINFKKIQDEN
jgi:hypothetical protein